MNFRVLRLVLWGLVALAAGWFVIDRLTPKSMQETVLNNVGAALSVSNPYLSLIDDQGRAFETGTFKGTHQLVYFGFTFCPDVCPISARKMLIAETLYNQNPGKIPVHSLFVTIDPQRDTPDIMEIYAQNLVESVLDDFPEGDRQAIAPDLTALTGSQAQIDAATAMFNVYADKVEEDGAPDAYRFNHTDLIYWVSPSGTVRFFSPRQTASDIAATLKAAS